MDTISDMLSRIRNASLVGRGTIIVPHSRLNQAVAEILSKYGFITNVRPFKDSNSTRRQLSMEIVYTKEGRPRISSLRRVSRPGQRIYRRKQRLQDVHNGMGLTVVSTSQGLMSAREAKVRDLGGEVICEVW